MWISRYEYERLKNICEQVKTPDACFERMIFLHGRPLGSSPNELCSYVLKKIIGLFSIQEEARSWLAKAVRSFFPEDCDTNERLGRLERMVEEIMFLGIN